MILFDANVLVHAHAAQSPFHAVARRLCEQAADGTLGACLNPQVLCEFFAVATNERLFRPAMTPKQAGQQIAVYWRSGFQKILPKEQTIRRVADLLQRHRITQQRVYDTFLVATMLDNDVRAIYTQNVKDFEIYHEIEAVNPFSARAHLPEASS